MSLNWFLEMISVWHKQDLDWDSSSLLQHICCPLLSAITVCQNPKFFSYSLFLFFIPNFFQFFFVFKILHNSIQKCLNLNWNRNRKKWSQEFDPPKMHLVKSDKFSDFSQVWPSTIITIGKYGYFSQSDDFFRWQAVHP